MKYLSRIFSLIMIAAFVLSSAGCTAGTSREPDADMGDSADPSPEETSAPPAVPAPDPEDVPEDTTNYEIDAGNAMQEYEYPDDPMPADSIVDTLCNLNQEYLSGLRRAVDGVPVFDDGLRTSLVGLSDLLVEWDMLRPHFPVNAADIDRAHEIYESWDEALVSEENGDSEAAQRSMGEAEKVLKLLPESAEVECF